jgi:hypothetical protein
VEFEGVAIRFAQLNHVQWRCDFENLCYEATLFQSKEQANKKQNRTQSEVKTIMKYLRCNGQLTFPSRILALKLQLISFRHPHQNGAQMKRNYGKSVLDLFNYNTL